MDHLFCFGGKLPSINTLAEDGRNGCKGWSSIFGVFIQLLIFSNKVRNIFPRGNMVCQISPEGNIFFVHSLQIYQ